jgi:hypothetical protein
MKDLWQVYFVIHTRFWIPCVLAMSEYTVLSKKCKHVVWITN